MVLPFIAIPIRLIILPFLKVINKVKHLIQPVIKITWIKIKRGSLNLKWWSRRWSRLLCWRVIMIYIRFEYLFVLICLLVICRRRIQPSLYKHCSLT
jgi:hypothetical protein